MLVWEVGCGDIETSKELTIWYVVEYEQVDRMDGDVSGRPAP